MRPHRFLLLAAALVALAMCTPASAADTVLAQLLQPTTIRHHGGIQVFSAYDGSVYHLTIRRSGAIERLPVAPSKAPFDVDIGSDARDRPRLIYTRCKVESDSSSGINENRGCDLFTLSLSGGGAERPVRGANTSANEIRPTLWKGRIAFVRGSSAGRQQEVGEHERGVVYTRRLTAPRSRRSKRLAQISGGRVVELELHRDHLAQIVERVRREEVRLIDISDRSTRRLFAVGVGQLGAHYLAGVGFAGGRLMWARDCAGGCVRGIYRYRLSTGEHSRAEFPRVLNGSNPAGLAPFASNGAYIVDGEITILGNGCGEISDEVLRPCQLIRSQPLKFKRLPR